MGFNLYAQAINLEREGDLLGATHLYERSAQLGCIPALNNLGWIYRNAKDPRAIDCFKEATRFGYALAIQNLAEMFESGELIAQDLNAAQALYHFAATQETEHENPDNLQVEGLDTSILECRAKMIWFLPSHLKSEVINWLTLALTPNSDIDLDNDIGQRARTHQKVTEKLLFDVNHRGCTR